MVDFKYNDYVSKFLYLDEFKKIGNMDLFNTKNYIFSEYNSLFASANCQTYPLLKNIFASGELEFYIYLDLFTYIPFEKLGYNYINKKFEKDNKDIVDYKFDNIMNLFYYHRILLSEDKKENIKLFFNSYNNDIFEINTMSLAIISLRLFHRFVTIMNFGGNLASMTIHKKISKILDNITEDVKSKNLKEINIGNYLPEFDFENNKLNKEMVEYIELCLEKEKSPQGIKFIYNDLIYIDHPYKDYYSFKTILNSNIFYFNVHNWHRVGDLNISYLEFFVKELKLSNKVYLEADFYEYYDSITYIPFGKKGYDYLKNKNILLNEIKFVKTMKLLNKYMNKDKVIIEEEILKLKDFYNNFYNDKIKLDPIGIATIYRRICIDLEEQIILKRILTKENADFYFSQKIDKIIKDIKENNLTEIKISDYIKESQFKVLNTEQIEYLEESYQNIFVNDF